MGAQRLAATWRFKKAEGLPDTQGPGSSQAKMRGMRGGREAFPYFWLGARLQDSTGQPIEAIHLMIARAKTSFSLQKHLQAVPHHNSQNQPDGQPARQSMVSSTLAEHTT